MRHCTLSLISLIFLGSTVIASEDIAPSVADLQKRIKRLELELEVKNSDVAAQRERADGLSHQLENHRSEASGSRWNLASAIALALQLSARLDQLDGKEPDVQALESALRAEEVASENKTNTEEERKAAAVIEDIRKRYSLPTP